MRIEFPGGVYHITSRGNARQRIFRDGADYRSFFSLLGDVAGDCDWRCYAYCLMPNHYHLVLTTPTGALSRGMRHLNGVHAQRFHCRHGTVGHVFQGRFKSIIVDRDAYLLEVCRYVMLNPVRAGLAKTCGAWRWSSYPATVGSGPKPSFLASECLLERFSGSPAKARAAFIEFVEGGIKARSPLDEVRRSMFLGSDAFVAGFRDRIAPRSDDRAFPRAQRLAGRPPLQEILTETENRILRGQQILQARDRWGYRFAEVAEHLRLHRNTVAALARKAAATPDECG